MVGIYKITNKINNKSYIGQSIHCGKRLDEHCKGNQLIDEIIQLEGIENFTFEILKEVNKNELSYWEDYYIIKYNTIFPNGYNKKWNCSGRIRKNISKELKNDNEKNVLLTKGETIENISQQIIKVPEEDKQIFFENLYKPTARMCEALSYGEKRDSKLTDKQHLIYSYLMSLSRWDAQHREHHYYVYKNKFKIKDACSYLGISQPTWRAAINKLIELNYIKEDDTSKAYIIRLITPYAPLDIQLIKDLVDAGVKITAMNKGNVGGNIVSVYSLIYEYCRKCGGTCEINVNQLKKIYTSARTEEATLSYRFMLGYFYSRGLMDITFITRSIAGTSYISYIIKNVRTDIPENLNDDIAPENIDDIFEKLQVQHLDTVELE